MKIIITEQQFNLILLGEGKGTGTGFKQYTPEEVETSEENYENLSPKLLLKYNDYVKQFEEYYTNTGKLIPLKKENGNMGNWYVLLGGYGLVPKFYKDVKLHEKIEEIKKQTYIDIVDYYNDLYKTSGIIFTQEYNPDYGWLGKENSKPLKRNPDYVWLYKNKKLGDFYKETFYHERKELLKEPLKDEKYDRLVKKYNKLWDEKREIISSSIPNTNPRKANPDYVWLRENKKWEEFKIATKHKQRVKEMGGRFRNHLIKNYGFIPQEATAQQVLDYIEKKGVETWDDFSKKERYLYVEIPDDVRDEVKKKYNPVYVRYGFYPQKATPEEIANYVLQNYKSWSEFYSKNKYLYQTTIDRKIVDDVLKLLPDGFKSGENIGEKYIKNWLDSNKTTKSKFKAQDETCGIIGRSGKRCLIMDFYSSNFNGYEVCIEFDGRQHFEKVNWSGEDTDEEMELRLQNNIENDAIKNQYCKNKIKLYRIKHNSKNSVSKDVIYKIMEVIINDIESGKFEHEFNKKGYIDTQNIPNDKETEI